MTHLSIFSPTAPDPTMLIIVVVVLAGAALAGLLLLAEVVGFRLRSRRRAAETLPTPEQQWATATAQTAVQGPRRVREVAGSRA